MKLEGKSSAAWNIDNKRAKEGDVLFGHAVSSNCVGDKMIVGAPIQAWTSATEIMTLEEDSGVAKSTKKGLGVGGGKAYLVNTQTGKIYKRFEAPMKNNPLFGHDVAMSCDGDLILISSPSAKSGGAVFLYNSKGKLLKAFPNPTWVQHKNITKKSKKKWSKFRKGDKDEEEQENEEDEVTEDDENAIDPNELKDKFQKDRYGMSIAILGKRIAVGAPSSDPNKNGEVYIFNTRGNLLQTIVPPNPKPTGIDSYSSFGTSIAINARGQLLVGAPDHDTVWLYDPSGEVVQTYRVPYSTRGIAATVTTLRFGQQIQMDASGSTVIISAPGNVAVAGRVYIYDNVKGIRASGITPQPSDLIEAPHPQTNDQFGSSLGLDFKGKVLVVGAPYEDNHDNNDGIAHVYQINRDNVDGKSILTTDLMETLESRTPISEGRFGRSVAINGPGTQAIIGSEEGLLGVYCRHDTGIFKWRPCVEHYGYGPFSLPDAGFFTSMVTVVILLMLYTFLHKTRVHKQYTSLLLRRYQKLNQKEEYNDYESQSRVGSYSNHELQLNYSLDFHNNSDLTSGVELSEHQIPQKIEDLGSVISSSVSSIIPSTTQQQAPSQQYHVQSVASDYAPPPTAATGTPATDSLLSTSLLD